MEEPPTLCSSPSCPNTEEEKIGRAKIQLLIQTYCILKYYMAISILFNTLIGYMSYKIQDYPVHYNDMDNKSGKTFIDTDKHSKIAEKIWSVPKIS